MTKEFCLNVQTDWAIRSWVQLGLRAKIIQLLQFHLFSQCSHYCLCQSPHWFKQNLAKVVTVVAEWIDGIHYRRIFKSSYRKLSWVRFEPTKTEFHSETLTNRAISSWVQLALRANFVQLLQFNLFISIHVLFWPLPLSVTTFV